LNNTATDIKFYDTIAMKLLAEKYCIDSVPTPTLHSFSQPLAFFLCVFNEADLPYYYEFFVCLLQVQLAPTSLNNNIAQMNTNMMCRRKPLASLVDFGK